jgi:hypothetical protein
MFGSLFTHHPTTPPQLEMGFDEAKSKEYLEKHDFDREKALEALLAAS